MKSAFRRTVTFALAVLGIVAFVGAPLVSYRHLPQHARGILNATLVGAEETPRQPDGDERLPASAFRNAQKSRPSQDCHDPDCPYLHFLRNNASPPSTSPILVAGASASPLCLSPGLGRVERNPRQLAVLSFSPATSPPAPLQV